MFKVGEMVIRVSNPLEDVPVGTKLQVSRISYNDSFKGLNLSTGKEYLSLKFNPDYFESAKPNWKQRLQK